MNISETFLTWLDTFCKAGEGPMWLLKLLPSAKTARHRSGEKRSVTVLLSGQQTWQGRRVIISSPYFWACF